MQRSLQKKIATFIAFLKSFYCYGFSLCIYAYAHAAVPTWKSEDTLAESVLSFYKAGPTD